MRSGEHRRPVRSLALERHPHRAELGLDEVVAGHDQLHAGCCLCGGKVELLDAGMGMRRAQHIGIGLAEQIVVVLETTVAAQEALVLEAPHWLADAEFTHVSASYAPGFLSGRKISSVSNPLVLGRS